MTTFTKGQKVRRTRRGSVYIRIGDEAAVASADRDETGDSWITLEGHGDKEFLGNYFEPVDDAPAPLDPSKVKVGDTVTLTNGTAPLHGGVVDSVRERAAQLWFRFRFGEQADAYFEVPLSDRFGEGYTLTAHQPAPEPEPEWKPGTVYGADGQSERYWFSDDGSSDGAVFRNDVGDEYAPSELAHLDLKSLVVIDLAKVDVDAVASAIAHELGLMPNEVEPMHREAAVGAIRALGIEVAL